MNKYSRSVFILACALLIVLTVSNSHLNIKYSQVLKGESPLTKLIAREMYNEFRSPYHEKSEYRFNLFSARIENIIRHNSNKSNTWQKGVNQFSDMTFEEFKQKKLMEPQECSATYDLKVENKNVQIPSDYDWLSKGVITPVKDQGECGSCWTFSTAGTMEAHWNILGKGRNVTFSEQQIVDCAWDFNNFGCYGGLPSQAYEYIRYRGGLETSATYPYTGKQGECVFRPRMAVGYVRFGSYNITRGDESQLAERLYNVGPMSITFQVTDDFMDYYSGIYQQDGCGTTPDDVNHAVVATGYGVEGGVAFWNVKNSWGTDWGVKGYFRILRGKNMCAVAQCNSYPLIDSPAGLVQTKQVQASQ